MFFEGFVGLWHLKNSDSIDCFKTQMCFKKDDCVFSLKKAMTPECIPACTPVGQLQADASCCSPDPVSPQREQKRVNYGADANLGLVGVSHWIGKNNFEIFEKRTLIRIQE